MGVLGVGRIGLLISCSLFRASTRAYIAHESSSSLNHCILALDDSGNYTSLILATPPAPLRSSIVTLLLRSPSA